MEKVWGYEYIGDTRTVDAATSGTCARSSVTTRKTRGSSRRFAESGTSWCGHEFAPTRSRRRRPRGRRTRSRPPSPSSPASFSSGPSSSSSSAASLVSTTLPPLRRPSSSPAWVAGLAVLRLPVIAVVAAARRRSGGRRSPRRPASARRRPSPRSRRSRWVIVVARSWPSSCSTRSAWLWRSAGRSSSAQPRWPPPAWWLPCRRGGGECCPDERPRYARAPSARSSMVAPIPLFCFAALGARADNAAGRRRSPCTPARRRSGRPRPEARRHGSRQAPLRLTPAERANPSREHRPPSSACAAIPAVRRGATSARRWSANHVLPRWAIRSLERNGYVIGSWRRSRLRGRRRAHRRLADAESRGVLLHGLLGRPAVVRSPPHPSPAWSRSGSGEWRSSSSSACSAPGSSRAAWCGRCAGWRRRAAGSPKVKPA